LVQASGPAEGEGIRKERSRYRWGEQGRKRFGQIGKPWDAKLYVRNGKTVKREGSRGDQKGGGTKKENDKSGNVSNSAARKVWGTSFEYEVGAAARGGRGKGSKARGMRGT